MVMKKNFTITIPTVINSAILKCGRCENCAKTEPTKSNQT